MVKVLAKFRGRSRTYDFKTKKEADRFVKFLAIGQKGGASKGSGIISYRKPKTSRRSYGGIGTISLPRFRL